MRDATRHTVRFSIPKFYAPKTTRVAELGYWSSLATLTLNFLQYSDLTKEFP
jgi:hypothetical protein